MRILHRLPPLHPASDSLALPPTDVARLKAAIAPLAELTDQALRQNLASHVPFIEEVGAYGIFSGGKRLRPVLFMLVARLLGREADPKYAAIFEYLHAATLLHDDVIDEAGLRRGRKAARKVYGNEAVILVGDFLFSKAYSLAVELSDQRFVAALARCTTTMAEGQVLELLATGEWELAPQRYLEVIVAKTAVLMAAACEMGAIFAGASQAVVDALYDYGLRLGVAFQLVDDALDYGGTQQEFGKPVGHDLAEGKVTLPFIHVRDSSPPPVSRRLVELARRADSEPEALAEARRVVVEGGGVDYTLAVARSYTMSALEPLAALEKELEPTALELLKAIASYVVRRRS